MIKDKDKITGYQITGYQITGYQNAGCQNYRISNYRIKKIKMKTFEQVIDLSIAYLVGRTSRSIIKRLSKKFSDSNFDVSYEQWSILVHLYRKDGQTQQELARLSIKDKAAITRLLNLLEKKNIVLRIPDRNDKRSKLVYLTNKAKDFRPDLIAAVKELLKEAELNIPQDEMVQCKNTLNKIFFNIDQLNQ